MWNLLYKFLKMEVEKLIVREEYIIGVFALYKMLCDVMLCSYVVFKLNTSLLNTTNHTFAYIYIYI